MAWASAETHYEIAHKGTDSHTHTHTHTHTPTSESEPCALDFRSAHLSVSLFRHLSLSFSHMQMYTFPSDSLTLRDHYLWHIADTES